MRIYINAPTQEQIQAIKDNRMRSVSIMPTEYFEDILRKANFAGIQGEMQALMDHRLIISAENNKIQKDPDETTRIYKKKS